MAVNWTLALKIILWLWYWFNSIYVSFSLHKSSISILMRPKQCRPILLLTANLAVCVQTSRGAATRARSPWLCPWRPRPRRPAASSSATPRPSRPPPPSAGRSTPAPASPTSGRAGQIFFAHLIVFYETYFLSTSPSCRSAALSLTKHKIRWWPHILACEGLLLTLLHPQVLRHQDRAGRGAVLGLQPRGRGRVALRVQTCGCR